MKGRQNLILLGVLLALCFGYWLMIRSEEATRERAAEARKVFSFAPEDLETITISREGERPTTGVRDSAAQWRIAEPKPIAANALVWDRVAKNLAELSSERTLDDRREDVGAYGLDDPVLRVNAATRDGANVEVHFGVLDPTQKYRYARAGDGPVFLVNPDTFFELNRDLLWLRDRDLFKEGELGITQIEYARIRPATIGDDGSTERNWEESVVVSAERDANGVWRVLGPTPGTGDQAMLNDLAGELQFAIGRNYIDYPEDLQDYNLDPPKARLTVRSGDGPAQTAYFGSFEAAKKEDAGVYVMHENSDHVFVVDAHMVTLFPANPDAWNEKRILTRPAMDLTSIRYEAGAQQFALENVEDGGWQLTEPRREKTDQGGVSTFISTLLSLNGSEYYPERSPEFGLDEPVIRIALAWKDIEEPGYILVGAETPDGRRRYVTQDNGAVTTLTNEEVGRLAVSIKDFLSKSLLSFKRDLAREVRLMFEGTEYVFVRGEQAWKVERPTGKVWDSQNDMQGLIAAITPLNAESVDADPAPEDLSIFGLDNPVAEWSVTLAPEAEGGQVQTLGPVSIGGICPDDNHMRYAKVKGRDQIFRVRQAVVGKIREVLRGVRDS
ncbi:MAG: hypothetical protein AMXMBFR4_13180 [Candidatus Hydrogenedentota bacterium]